MKLKRSVHSDEIVKNKNVDKNYIVGLCTQMKLHSIKYIIVHYGNLSGNCLGVIFSNIIVLTGLCKCHTYD